jgi:ABC-2 type transport system ATP-binding protein
MKQSDDIAIRVNAVSKSFKLPHERQTSLKGALINMVRGGRGYERQQVLKDISLDIKKGEFFGIVGRNGSGKSTMLKLLAGIYSPDEGEVQINGQLTPFIELGVGFNPELTGRENVYLNGALLGFNRKEVDAMYDDIVVFAELEKFMDQKLKNYSSGMQVRLAFSIATRAKTDILLVDEVLAVGDQSFQEKCFDYFSEIKKSNKTVVFVTHDMSNVERFCDRVFVIDRKSEVNGLYTIPEAVAIYNQLNHEKVASQTDTDEVETSQKVERKREGVWIETVKLRDAHGRSSHKFTVGQPLEVEITIGSDPAFANEAVVVGLAFHARDNTNIAGPNSRNHTFKASDKRLTFHIDEVAFNMGEYYLTVALFDGQVLKQYDLIDKGVQFFVNSKSTHYGLTVLKDTWSKS